MAVRAVFLWHLHQPEYRDPQTGRPILPWVRQHASRAYTDMAAALERHPQVKAVANWAPSLLSQLEAYVAGTQDADEQLARKPAESLAPEERAHVLREGFSADWNVWVRPVARYSELLDKRGTDLRQIDLLERQAAFTAQELRDLQVQFVLAWMGFTARREEPRISELVAKERGYTEEEKIAAVDAQRRIASRIVPRWRELAERGQVEITCSPFYHPILPLIVDSDSARRAMPAASLPPRFSYPQDAREQVLRGIERARVEFGQAPHGMWPSEGSVSPEVIDLLAACGVRWCATDQGILERSELELGSALPDGYPAHYHPYLAGADHAVTVLFRDRELSDRIGFRYAKSDPREAAQDLISRIADTEPEALVTLALDGENPWEHYPGSGEGFLEALYRGLAGGAVRTVLPRDELREHPARARIARLHSGSWPRSSSRRRAGTCWWPRSATGFVCTATTSPPRARPNSTRSFAAGWRTPGARSACPRRSGSGARSSPPTRTRPRRPPSSSSPRASSSPRSTGMRRAITSGPAPVTTGRAPPAAARCSAARAPSPRSGSGFPRRTSTFASIRRKARISPANCASFCPGLARRVRRRCTCAWFLAGRRPL